MKQICCTDDAHMIGMCDVAQLVRNDRHSLPVVEGCVKRFRVACQCIGILAEVECGSVALVKVNEYTALPRAVNAVAITAFHAVRDARIVGMSAAADKRTVVTVHVKVMKSIGHRLPSTHNVVLHPGNNETPLSRALHPRHLWHLFPHSIPLTATTNHREEQLDGHVGTRACLHCTPTTTWCLTKSAQGLPAPKSARTATSPVRQRLTVLKMLW